MTVSRHSFKNLGEFCATIARSTFDKDFVDPAVQQILATSNSEGAGFAAPVEFIEPIENAIRSSPTLFSMCDVSDATSNNIVQPVLKEPPWSTTGLRAYWTNREAVATQSKMALQTLDVSLDRLTILIPATDELLDDADQLDQYLRAVAVDNLSWEVDRAIIAGSGVGQPLGILNAASTISVGKESGQGADTILTANLTKMLSRLNPSSLPGARWLCSSSVFAQMLALSSTVAGFSGSDSGLTVFGIPCIATEACEPLGDPGDVILVNLKKYRIVLKRREARSMHIWFDQNMTAFRFSFRIGGMPWLSSAISSRTGNTTLSDFIVLDERA